jgi:hypothetical protein
MNNRIEVRYGTLRTQLVRYRFIRRQELGKVTKVFMVTGGSLALLVGAGWLGLQIEPKPFPPHPEGTGEMNVAELPSHLPDPVRQYFKATLGEEVPHIGTAVVWGRGYFNLNGLWFPMRFKSYNVAGRQFLRDMELTWFGIPIFRGYDAYLNEKGTLEFTGLLGLLNVSDSGDKIDQGDNVAMWAEAPFTTPSALVLDPRVRWEPIDNTSARLIVPFGEQEDSLLVEFDPETSLITRVTGMRYRGQEETKIPYRGEYSAWTTVHGIKIPYRPVATWEDQDEPYVILDIEGVEYNVDVSDKVP